MDCNELNQNLEKLRGLHDELRSKIDSATESGTGRQGIIDIKRQLSDISDTALAKYLPDFAEKFPGRFGWELGGEIEFGETICDTVPLSDNRFVTVGIYGKPRILSRLPDGEWGFSEEDEIEGADNSILGSIVPLSDEQFATLEVSGELRILSRSEDGKWRLGEVIEGLDYTTKAFTPLPDGRFAVGGALGKLRILSRSEDGKWGFDQTINEFESISAITSLSDGQIVVGGHDKVGILSKMPDGSWGFSEKIEKSYYSDIDTIIPLPDSQFAIVEKQFCLSQNGNMEEKSILEFLSKSPDGEWETSRRVAEFDGSISAIAPLPDGQFVLGGDSSENPSTGELRILSRSSEDGGWGLGDQIEGFEGAIKTITPLPDGQFAVGGAHGELRALFKTPDGRWRLGERIEGFGEIRTIIPLSDYQYAVEDYDCPDKLKILTAVSPDLETLRRAILSNMIS